MSENGSPGASLRVWRDFFPNAQIYGGDIDDTILFTEERIKTFKLDQTKITSIEEFLSKIEEEIDIIIDDGLHEFSGAITLFENAFLRLANGGIYVIEDVAQRDIVKFSNYFSARSYKVEFIAMYRALLNLDDNFLIVVRKPLV